MDWDEIERLEAEGRRDRERMQAWWANEERMHGNPLPESEPPGPKCPNHPWVSLRQGGLTTTRHVWTCRLCEAMTRAGFEIIPQADPDPFPCPF